jgi:hypothetical protein
VTLVFAFIAWISLVLSSFIFSFGYVTVILVTYGTEYLAGVVVGEFVAILFVFWIIEKIYFRVSVEKMGDES